MMRWLLISILLPTTSLAQVQRMDYPLTVTGNSSWDPSTHLYTYAYAVGNPVGTPANGSLILVQVQPGVDVITDLRAPAGWSAIYSEEKGVVSWAATEVDVPAGYVDDGNILEGRATVKPGSSLSGFSFKSFGSPGSGAGITQTFARLHEFASEDDAEVSGAGSQLPSNNGYRFTTTVPMPDADYSGNRRPTVDGFLVFANLVDGASYQGAALVVYRLAVGGETVYPQTLQVTLNKQDVTAMFSWNSQFKGYAATFSTQNSSLRSGKNVLVGAIDGVVPDTTRMTKDIDQLSFAFTP